MIAEIKRPTYSFLENLIWYHRQWTRFFTIYADSCQD